MALLDHPSPQVPTTQTASRDRFSRFAGFTMVSDRHTTLYSVSDNRPHLRSAALRPKKVHITVISVGGGNWMRRSHHMVWSERTASSRCISVASLLTSFPFSSSSSFIFSIIQSAIATISSYRAGQKGSHRSPKTARSLRYMIILRCLWP